MSLEWANYRHFTRDVDFPDGDPQPELLELLDEAREHAGIPFVVTSGVRTPERNEAVGGTQSSAHTRGLAADLRAETSRERFLILEALILHGAQRIGVYPTHIHVDVDESLPE